MSCVATIATQTTFWVAKPWDHYMDKETHGMLSPSLSSSPFQSYPKWARPVMASGGGTEDMGPDVSSRGWGWGTGLG